MKNLGLLITKIGLTDWLFSSTRGMKVLQPDGQWDDFLPTTDELQNANGFDPYSCTSYGSINGVTTLLRRLGIDADYSERFTAIVSNTVPPGNDPHTVMQAIKNMGLIHESILPYGPARTLEEYYTPKPMTDDLLAIGRRWLDKYAFNHFWAFKPEDSVEMKSRKIKEALKYSPVCVSVYAWVFRNGIAVKPPNVTDGHWCVIYGYNPDGTWKCFDSLDYSRKTLDADYNFTYGKTFSITPKVSTPKKMSWAWFADIIRKICKR